MPRLRTIRARLLSKIRTDRLAVGYNTLWLILGHSVRLGAGMVIGIWLARHLGPEAFGSLAYALAFVALFFPIANLGLEGILTRRIVLRHEHAPLYLGTTFLLRLIGAAAAVTTAILIAMHVERKTFAVDLCLILSASLVFRPFFVLESWYQAEALNRRVAIAAIVATIGASVAKSLFILLDLPIQWLAGAYASEYAVYAMALVTLLSRGSIATPHRWHVSPRLARQFLAESWPLTLSAAATAVYLKIDVIMLGALRDEQEVGAYAVAALLSEAWYFLPTTFATALFPLLVSLKTSEPGRYGAYLQDAYSLLFAAGLVIAIAMSSCSHWIIGILYGSAYAQAALILAIHVWATPFIFMQKLTGKWLIAENLIKLSLVAHVLGAVTNFVANLFLIEWMGGTGAALATVFSYAFASYLFLYLHPRTQPAAIMMTQAMFAPLTRLRSVLICRSNSCKE